jgi:hypothetical protein
MRRRVVAIVAFALVVSAALPMFYCTTTGERNSIASAKKAQIEASSEQFLLESLRKQTAYEESIDALREKYPLESLRERLAYEKSIDRNKAPKLSTEAAQRLDLADAEHGFGHGDIRNIRWTDARTISLAMLHDENILKFVKSAKFGRSRIVEPGEMASPDFLEQYRRPAPIPLAAVPALSAEEASLEAPVALSDRPYTGDDVLARWRLPKLTEARGVHDGAAGDFANPFTLGFIRDVDHVAGFEPHAVLQAPRWLTDRSEVTSPNSPKGAVGTYRSWKVVRLELVSLEKHETPRVYRSENLPRMEDLSAIDTRKLSPFEAAALKKLTAGDDFDTQAGPNRIEMLGSLRASKVCLECHDAPRGTLLGALSYELRRVPPIRVDSLEQAAAQ